MTQLIGRIIVGKLHRTKSLVFNGVIYQSVTLGLVRTIQMYYTSPIAILAKEPKRHFSHEQFSVIPHESDVTNVEDIVTSTVYSQTVPEIVLQLIYIHQFIFCRT